MAFEIGLWSNGGVHMLVICEEAHRYVPADASLGFVPTRQAIARIAKEGRKYGVSLGVVTQRPGELDPTILSQCSTVFAMRLSNDRDQDIIRSAIPNSSISSTSFISSIGNGEAIAFGEAVAVPMRMRFTRVDEKNLPKANGIGVKATDETPDTVDLRSVVARMRALNGPDISSFQQAYSASLGLDEDVGAPAYPDADSSRPPGLIAEPRNEPSTPAIEPYNPAMLPRAEPVNPQLERFNQIRNQLLSEEPAQPKPEPYQAPPPRAAPSFAQPGTDLPRPSLRESLLKKPLSSIIRK
jgi:hypothetical protein